MCVYFIKIFRPCKHCKKKEKKGLTSTEEGAGDGADDKEQEEDEDADE